jgi:hypothetical protein
MGCTQRGKKCPLRCGACHGRICGLREAKIAQRNVPAAFAASCEENHPLSSQQARSLHH